MAGLVLKAVEEVVPRRVVRSTAPAPPNSPAFHDHITAS